MKRKTGWVGLAGQAGNTGFFTSHLLCWISTSASTTSNPILDSSSRPDPVSATCPYQVYCCCYHLLALPSLPPSPSSTSAPIPMQFPPTIDSGQYRPSYIQYPTVLPWRLSTTWWCNFVRDLYESVMPSTCGWTDRKNFVLNKQVLVVGQIKRKPLFIVARSRYTPMGVRCCHRALLHGVCKPPRLK